MAGNRKHISIFEHQTVKLGDRFNGGQTVFDEHALNVFQQYYGEKGVPYYTLVHKGIRFNQYVGVIQVSNIAIEVLPKADKVDIGHQPEKEWRNILINMLLTVGIFKVKSPGSSLLKLKPDNLLDLYFELFLNEVEYLLHNGLLKKYRTEEANATALKGNLCFSQHIRKNLIHQERFYVRFTTYDTQHQLHGILYKTIRLLKQINTNMRLHSRIGAMLLNFPEMPDLQVTDTMFERIIYDRKTESYRNALSIARLLLLNYHPDIRNGHNNVLALMFDMNKLWEEFVYISLRRNSRPGETVYKQVVRKFWKPEMGRVATIRPDILITTAEGHHIILDAKWKTPANYKPDSNDLRQMYVYHQYYNAHSVALVYPGNQEQWVKGKYMSSSKENPEEVEKECHVFTLPIGTGNIRQWQEKIYNDFREKLMPNYKA